MQINPACYHIVTQSDRHRSMGNKQDIIYLINKFLLNKDGTPPTKASLQRYTRQQLFIIWEKNKPKDLYAQFHSNNQAS